MTQCILLFSGKRKSGKDFLTDKLVEMLPDSSVVLIKISAPIKSHFAKTKNLNLQELMSDGQYKECYRKEMIQWSDIERLKNPGIFCQSALEMYKTKGIKIWIVSDVRRKTDIKWFKDSYGDIVKTVRVVADDKSRIQRNWKFTPGIDDAPSECDLDNEISWDWVIDNNLDSNPFPVLNDIVALMKKYLVT